MSIWLVSPRWRRLTIVSFISLCLLAAQALAQPHFAGEGRVVAVDAEKGTVTLDHAPIPGLMPAMRMTFPVLEAEALREFQMDDRVRFALQSRGPEWVIATIQPTAPPSSPSPALFPAPEFALPTLSGDTLRLSDLRGKAVLLNFWATWCVPCRTEMPSIERLYQRYRDRGLEIVAVNLDMLSTAGVEAFVKEVEVTFRIVLDPSWATARAYYVRGVPVTYLIDRAGNVVVREMGARDWADGVSQAAVEGLLQEPKPDMGR